MQIAIVVYPGMTALDALGPYEVLNAMPGAKVRFVWKEVGPIVADSGVLTIGATHTFDETREPDLVLVPGSSMSTATMMGDRSVLAWLRAIHRSTRLTTSVCSGALILAAAGLLEGRAATSHWAALPLLGQFGALARPNDRIVRDGKVWTAAGVSAGIDLALAIVAELDSEETAQVVQLMIEYDPQPPFDAGHMTKASAAVRARAQREMLRLATSPRELAALPAVLLQRWMHVLRRKVRGERAIAPVQ
jgi:transcriptional regulator GlxA family with amidase domain